MLSRVLTLALLMTVPAAAQTPKAVTVDNARVTKTWTIVGYEVSVPDPANPLNGSISIRVQLVTKLGAEVLTTESQTVTCSGPKQVAALVADMEKRVRDAITAGDKSPYFNGTRAALYAWLQANGHIEKDAQ